MPSPLVSIDVPTSVSIPTEGLYNEEMICLASFSPTSRDCLRRILAACAADGVTLAAGAPVTTVGRVLEYLVEQVHANE